MNSEKENILFHSHLSKNGPRPPNILSHIGAFVSFQLITYYFLQEVSLSRGMYIYIPTYIHTDMEDIFKEREKQKKKPRSIRKKESMQYETRLEPDHAQMTPPTPTVFRRVHTAAAAQPRTRPQTHVTLRI